MEQSESLAGQDIPLELLTEDNIISKGGEILLVVGGQKVKCYFVKMKDLDGMEGDIPLDITVPNPGQPRKDFNEKKLEVLKDDLAQNGQNVNANVVLVHSKKGFHFLIVDGERRYRALTNLGADKIFAKVGSVNNEKELLYLIARLENTKENHNPIERANTYKDLVEMERRENKNMSVSEACKKVAKTVGGLKEGSIQRDLKLAAFAEKSPLLAEMIINERVTPTEAIKMGVMAEKHGLDLEEAVKDFLDSQEKRDNKVLYVKGEEPNAKGVGAVTSDKIKKVMVETLGEQGRHEEAAELAVSKILLEVGASVKALVKSLGKLGKMNPDDLNFVLKSLPEFSCCKKNDLAAARRAIVEVLRTVYNPVVYGPTLESQKGFKFYDSVIKGETYIKGSLRLRIAKTLASEADRGGRALFLKDICEILEEGPGTIVKEMVVLEKELKEMGIELVRIKEIMELNKGEYEKKAAYVLKKGSGGYIAKAFSAKEEVPKSVPETIIIKEIDGLWKAMDVDLTDDMSPIDEAFAVIGKVVKETSKLKEALEALGVIKGQFYLAWQESGEIVGLVINDSYNNIMDKLISMELVLKQRQQDQDQKKDQVGLNETVSKKPQKPKKPAKKPVVKEKDVVKNLGCPEIEIGKTYLLSKNSQNYKYVKKGKFLLVLPPSHLAIPPAIGDIGENQVHCAVVDKPGVTMEDLEGKIENFEQIEVYVFMEKDLIPLPEEIGKIGIVKKGAKLPEGLRHLKENSIIVVNLGEKGKLEVKLTGEGDTKTYFLKRGDIRF